MRSLASEILPMTYCPAMYVAPTTPAAMAMPLRLRRAHLRVADIMVAAVAGATDSLSSFPGSDQLAAGTFSKSAQGQEM